MTVKELIKLLEKVGQHKKVRLWDTTDLREYEVTKVSEDQHVVNLD